MPNYTLFDNSNGALELIREALKVGFQCAESCDSEFGDHAEELAQIANALSALESANTGVGVDVYKSEVIESIYMVNIGGSEVGALEEDDVEDAEILRKLGVTND